MTRSIFSLSLAAVLVMTAITGFAQGQTAPALSSKPAASGAATPVPPTGVTLPAGFVIGPDDILSVLFWRDKDLTAEVQVRPDGRITLPLLNEVVAAGLTPDQLRAVISKEAAKYVEDANVTVVVKAINSRKVFVTGQVAKPGAYPITAPITVLQVLAMAGGVHEFADTKNILVLRTEGTTQKAYRVNYNEVLKRKNLKQNIELKPGDTVVVP